MLDPKLLILSSILLFHSAFSTESSSENSEDVFTLTGNRGVLNESFLPDSDKVKELKIINCNFQQTSTEAFKFMTSLKKVVIKYSEIEELPEGLFQAIPKLKEIQIKRTKIHHLNEEAFVNLTKLKEVEIEATNIQLVEDMFLGCEALEELELNQCEITKFTPEAFNGINLQELELKNNKIEAFSFRNFPKMTNLKSINLSGNPLTSFDITGIRENCPNLKKIKLKKTNVSSNILEQLKSLNMKVKAGD